MNKEPTPPRLAIGGWMIFVAYKLLLILSFSINNILFDFPYVITPDTTNTFPTGIYLAYLAVAAALSVYTALLFFGRRKEFKPAFTVLACLDTAFTVVWFFVTNQDRFESEIPVDFFTALRYIVPVVFNIACIVYLFFSKRVKNTYIFDRNAPDPAIRFSKTDMQDVPTEPLQIYGLIIVMGIQLISVTSTSFSELIRYLMRSAERFLLPETLLYGAVFVASVICILLFFERKKLFKWVFTGLVGITILYNAYFAFLNYTTGIYSDLNQAGFVAFWYIGIAITALFLIYYVALIVYALFSQRVKRTFVYETRIHLDKEKLVAFGYRVLRVKDVDAED